MAGWLETWKRGEGTCSRGGRGRGWALPLFGDEFQVLGFHRGGIATGAIVALEKIHELVVERGPIRKFGAAERPEGWAVELAQELHGLMGGEGEAEVGHATGRVRVDDPVAKGVSKHGLLAPAGGAEGGQGQRRMASEQAQVLAGEAIGGPVREGEQATGTTGSEELRGGGVEVGGEHDAMETGDAVEGIIGERKALGIGLEKSDGERLLRGPRACLGDEVSGEIDSGTGPTDPSRGGGQVPGSTTEVEQLAAWPARESAGELRCRRFEVLGDEAQVAGFPECLGPRAQ